MNYYNENDPKAAAWLRELIGEGHIPAGHVDERSICDVSADDVSGFTQCHFFAGIGGWSHALRLSGWPADQPVWTGSCPCQPFSIAGKRVGFDDPRNLWPQFKRLIAGCQPAIIFGEQVASADGRIWLAGVFADLEGMAYHRAGADLCAAGVGAPHIRQRLYWMAITQHHGSHRTAGPQAERGRDRTDDGVPIGSNHGIFQAGGGLADSNVEGFQRYSFGFVGSGHQAYWNNFQNIQCLDGKSRRIESGTFPLAHGVSGRVGLLRGYGNAIVPQLAATFIQAGLEAMANLSNTPHGKTAGD